MLWITKLIFQFLEEVISDVAIKLADIDNQLKPYLIALSAQERHDLFKMSDGSQPFVEKSLSYCQSNPEFAPSYINMRGIASDLTVYSKLMPIYRTIAQLESKLNDTTMEAGDESMVTALSYYNSVKNAAKDNVPGAKVIYEDLKKRFVREKSAPAVPGTN